MFEKGTLAEIYSAAFCEELADPKHFPDLYKSQAKRLAVDFMHSPANDYSDVHALIDCFFEGRVSEGQREQYFAAREKKYKKWKRVPEREFTALSEFIFDVLAEGQKPVLKEPQEILRRLKEYLEWLAHVGHDARPAAQDRAKCKEILGHINRLGLTNFRTFAKRQSNPYSAFKNTMPDIRLGSVDAAKDLLEMFGFSKLEITTIGKHSNDLLRYLSALDILTREAPAVLKTFNKTIDHYKAEILEERIRDLRNTDQPRNVATETNFGTFGFSDDDMPLMIDMRHVLVGFIEVKKVLAPEASLKKIVKWIDNINHQTADGITKTDDLSDARRNFLSFRLALQALSR